MLRLGDGEEMIRQMGMVIGLVFCVFVGQVLAAEAVTYNSALIWSSQRGGDYYLPEKMPDKNYVSEAVASTGLIKSISVSWKAQGRVKVQVSADDGLHYSNIINGVPLESGFVPGSTFKWKAIFDEGAKLIELKVVLKDAVGTVTSFGNPELAGFLYRKSIFTKGSKDTLYDYQLKVVVGESYGVQANVSCDNHLLTGDFSDIRFTLPDKETVLPHFLESITGNKPYRSAVFYVRVPELPPEGLALYVYYGNRLAKNISDPKSTFDFYEDFSDKKMFEQTWAVLPNIGGSLSLTGEGLILDGAGIISKEFRFKSGIIEYCASAKEGLEAGLIIHGTQVVKEPDLAQMAYSSAYKGAQHCIAVGKIVKANENKPISPGIDYNYFVSVDENNDILFRRLRPGFHVSDAEVSYKDTKGLKEGYIGLNSGTGADNNTTVFHWVRVRKLASPLPFLDKNLVGNEEPADAPLFVNTTLSPNGDIVIIKDFNEGAYILPEKTSGQEIRIFSTFLRGNGANCEIALGNGNFLKNLESNRYYYASKGDFLPSNRLRAKLVLKKTQSALLPRIESYSLVYAYGNIVVVYPTASEAFVLGSKPEIKWTAWDYERNYPLKITYSIDGGKSYQLIADKVKNSGVYVWNLADKKEMLTNEAVIKIE
ncbi:MAG TPA: DUF2341 domain-containing protein, partial [Candidatus Omnitrophota bacterium]|nr:DUF2341 domain-containing protein [Candidatus Omnitrophota bacterium]